MDKFSILIVDDDKNLLKSLKRALRKEGYILHFATRVGEALEKIRTENIDMVISDYQMPGTNGLQFLKCLKDSNPEILTIMMTGIEDVKIAAQAINEAGVYKFIIKPWSNEDLRITIKRAVENLNVVRERDDLLRKIKSRDAALQRLEREYPGISNVVKDEEGYIISC